jgi:hypothetical protein
MQQGRFVSIRRCSRQRREISVVLFWRATPGQFWRALKVEFTNLEVDATGTVDRQDGVTRFTEIVLRPKLTVPAGTNRERALRVLEKSEKACLVSASLSVPVHMEATIQEANEPAPAISRG